MHQEKERRLKAMRKTVEIKREPVEDQQSTDKNKANQYAAMFDTRTIMKRLSPKEPDCPA